MLVQPFLTSSQYVVIGNETKTFEIFSLGSCRVIYSTCQIKSATVNKVRSSVTESAETHTGVLVLCSLCNGAGLILAVIMWVSLSILATHSCLGTNV